MSSESICLQLQGHLGDEAIDINTLTLAFSTQSIASRRRAEAFSAFSKPVHARFLPPWPDSTSRPFGTRSSEL